MDSASLIPLLERANHIAAITDPDLLMEQTLALLMEVCGAEAGAVYWVDDTGEALAWKAGDRGVFGERMGLRSGPGREILRQEGPALKEDFSGGKYKSLVSIPLRLDGEPLGVALLFNPHDTDFDMAQVLANRMAGEIDRSIRLEASQQRNRRLEALISILEQIGSSLDRDQILRVIIDSARTFLGAEACSLFLKDETNGDLELVMASNINERIQVEQMRVPAGKGIIGHVVQTGETLLVADTSLDERHYGGVDRDSGFVTRSILAIPLCTRTVDLGSERGVTRERTIGGLEALNKLQGTFSEDDAQLLGILAKQAATVLEIAALYADTNDLFLDVVKSLTAAIDAKDPFTEGHSRRVSEYSVAIARELGLSAEEIHHIRIGSLLHDVGKIGVPDTILCKPGKLTREEYDLMKQHPAIGARMMSQVRSLNSELPMLAEHQERLDGSGYPRGLKGGEISLTGRIVAVADVFDAMTSDRPYHQRLPVEIAFEFLSKHVDTKFDRLCVEALQRAHDRNLLHFPDTEE